MKTLSVPERHQLKVARDTMKLNCVGARVLGGPNHRDAQEIIERLTGNGVDVPEGCDCGIDD